MTYAMNVFIFHLTKVYLELLSTSFSFSGIIVNMHRLIEDYTYDKINIAFYLFSKEKGMEGVEGVVTTG